jgi:undecaprenyl-diphosphatase
MKPLKGQRNAYVFLRAGVVFFGLFVCMALAVQNGAAQKTDDSILLAIHAHSDRLLDMAVPFVTDFGGVAGGVVITAGLLLYFVRQKKYASCTQLLVSLASAVIINLMLKALFARERPHLWAWLINETNYSFPSGHAAFSSALALVVVLLWWRSKYRLFIMAAGSTYVLAIGLSRLYLGVHYPSDIVAGWCVGFGCVALIAGVAAMLGLKPQAQ